MKSFYQQFFDQYLIEILYKKFNVRNSDNNVFYYYYQCDKPLNNKFISLYYNIEEVYDLFNVNRDYYSVLNSMEDIIALLSECRFITLNEFTLNDLIKFKIKNIDQTQIRKTISVFWKEKKKFFNQYGDIFEEYQEPPSKLFYVLFIDRFTNKNLLNKIKDIIKNEKGAY